MSSDDIVCSREKPQKREVRDALLSGTQNGLIDLGQTHKALDKGISTVEA